MSALPSGGSRLQPAGARSNYRSTQFFGVDRSARKTEAQQLVDRLEATLVKAEQLLEASASADPSSVSSRRIWKRGMIANCPIRWRDC